MANEAPEKSVPTVCGDPQCRCSRIMVNLLNSGTPFFFADNNFTRKTGPGLPAKFVLQHGREMAMVVNLEVAEMVFAVELVAGKAGKPDDRVRFGEGWESFMINTKFCAEDLLFFTLRGQSRLVVMSVRGHNRGKADAEPETPKGPLSDVPEGGTSSRVRAKKSAAKQHQPEGGTSSRVRAKSAAKQHQPGETSKPPVRSHDPLPPTLGSGEGAASQEPISVEDLSHMLFNWIIFWLDHGHQVSSHDALESHMPLLEASHSGSEDTEMEEPGPR